LGAENNDEKARKVDELSKRAEVPLNRGAPTRLCPFVLLINFAGTAGDSLYERKNAAAQWRLLTNYAAKKNLFRKRHLSLPRDSK